MRLKDVRIAIFSVECGGKKLPLRIANLTKIHRYSIIVTAENFAKKDVRIAVNAVKKFFSPLFTAFLTLFL